MNLRGWRFFAFLTLAGNIALAFLIGRELHLRESVAVVRPVATSRIPGLREKPITLPPRARPTVVGPTITWPPFRWADVQSTNYDAYAANLLAIGCPEETVEAVIEGATWLELAQVIHSYATEEHPLLWEMLTGSTNSEAKFDEAYKTIEEADDRRDEVLHALFRKPPLSAEQARTAEVDRRQSILKSAPDGFLPDEKLRALAELQLSLHDRSAWIQTNTPPDQRNAALKASQEEFNAAKTNLFSAKEMQELDLRTRLQVSNDRNSLGLLAYDATEHAALFAQSTNQAALRELLGPERAAKLSAIQDAGADKVEQFLQITRKFGRGPEVALAAAKADTAYRNQEVEIENDPKLLPRERRVLQALLEQQRIEKLRSLLGPDAWETYRFHWEY